MIRLLRYIAWRRLRRERLRTVITLLGIGLGVAVVLAIELANRATLNSVEVMVDQIAGETRLSVRGDAAGFPDSMLALVARHPAVGKALPIVEASSRHEETGATLLVLGVDLLVDSGSRGYTTEVSDPFSLVTRPDRVLVAAGYAGRHDLEPGSTMTLLTGRGLIPVTVGGVIESGGVAEAYGGKVIVMDVTAAQFLFQREGRLDRIDVVPAEAEAMALQSGGREALAALAARIGGDLPGSLRVELPESRVSQAAELLSSFQVNLRMVSTVALFVGMFLVYNTMSIAVVQRRREIGILRALGVPKGRVLALFTIEGFVYGLVGSGLGVLVGIGLARGALAAVTGTVSRLYLLVEATRVPLSPIAIAACMLLGTGVSTVAAFLPGREAAGEPPVVTLRQAPFQGSRRGRILLSVVVGVALLGLAAWLATLPPVRGVALFGYIAGFLVVFGFAFFSPLACILFGRTARPLLGRWFGIEGKLAADHLTRTIGRSALSVSALMTGLALVVCVATMIHSFKESIVVWIENTVGADLLVSTSAGEAAAASIPFPVEFGDSLATIPGVVSVNSFRLIESRYRGQGIAISSLLLADWIRDNRLIAIGRRLPGPPAPDWAIVSENFANRFRVGVGDTLHLSSPSGLVPVTVAVVFLDYTSDQGAIFIDRPLYARAWGDRLVDTFDLYIPDAADRPRVRNVIEDRFGRSRRFVILSQAELKARILGDVDATFNVVYALEAIALGIAILGIVNTLVASTLDRRRELGLLRAIGATRRQIGRLFVIEAAGMGIVGVILGLAAGYALSLLLVHVIQFQSTGWRFLYHFPYALVAITSVVTGVSAALAGYYPARIGAKTWGVEALQYE